MLSAQEQDRVHRYLQAKYSQKWQSLDYDDRVRLCWLAGMSEERAELLADDERPPIEVVRCVYDLDF